VKYLIFAVAGLLCGFLVTRFGQITPAIVAPSAPTEATVTAPGSADHSLERRVADLERALEVEREARQLLEDELFRLVGSVPLDPASNADEPRSSRSRRTRETGSDVDLARARRTERLVATGIEPARAEWMLRRESELQYEELQRRYEAGRNGTIDDYYSASYDYTARVREEFGDDDYERYLRASGRGGNVVISAVLEASPAQAAGRKPGDRITRYDGKRVFTMYDITREIMNGAAGESVVLEFERNGQPMQVVVPRGPVGISGGS